MVSIVNAWCSMSIAYIWWQGMMVHIHQTENQKTVNQKIMKHQPKNHEASTRKSRSINQKIMKHQRENHDASTGKSWSINGKIMKHKPENHEASTEISWSINQKTRKIKVFSSTRFGLLRSVQATRHISEGEEVNSIPT